MFLKKPYNFRASDEIIKHINELVDKFPDKYQNFSHCIRCAVMKLHKQEMEVKK